jgi:hypothetical protein
MFPASWPELTTIEELHTKALRLIDPRAVA